MGQIDLFENYSCLIKYVTLYYCVQIYIKKSYTRLWLFTTDYYISNRLIGQVGSVFANGPGDQGSIPGRVIPKTLKNGTWYLIP